MKILIGLAMAVIGGPITWWAFNKAAMGNDFYNWIWVIAMFVTAFGVILVLIRMRLWMRS